jgi:hypothetical protein
MCKFEDVEDCGYTLEICGESFWEQMRLGILK